MNDEERAFYASYRCADSPSASSLCSQFGVSVEYASADRGKIVRAARPIARGSVAWVESPLVGMAHLSSARLHSGGVCARCLRSVGSVQRAWDRASAVIAEDEANARDKARRKAAKKKKSTKAKAAAGETTADTEAAAAASPPPPLPAQLPFLDTAAAATASSSSDATAAASAHSSSSTLHLPLIPALPCLSGCASVYCSLECRAADWREGHELLCAAPWRAASAVDNAAPATAASACASPAPIDPAYARLLKHASAHNETFLLAAQSVSRMTLDALRRFRSEPRVQSALGLQAADPLLTDPGHLLPFALRLHAYLRSLPASLSSAFLQSTLSPLVDAASAPFRAFCGSCWWSDVALPSAVAAKLDSDDEADYRAALCGQAEQALTAVSELVESKVNQAAAVVSAAALSAASAASASAAPVPAAPSAAPSFDSFLSLLGLCPVYSLSLWGRLLSSFDLNNLGFHAPTQIGLYVSHVRGLTDAEQRADAAASLGQPLWAEMQRRVDSGPRLGSVEGTGLFTVACCMNHSCAPNISLRRKHACAEEEPTEIHDAHLRAQFDELMDRGWSGQADADAADSSVVSPSAASASASVSSSASVASAASASSPALPPALVDRRAVFVALRDICAGEELNISYIDLIAAESGEGPAATDAAAAEAETDAATASSSAAAASSPSDAPADAAAAAPAEVGLAARQRQLRAYGFDCGCTKCVRESLL